MYGLRVITPPTIEPVTLPEARRQCSIDDVGDDAILAGYILAERQWIEQVTGRAIMTQTLEMTLDDFPSGEILLPRQPVASIVSISYTDTAGSPQTVASYQLDATQLIARLAPAYGASWPSTRGTPGNVKVRFIAGESQAPAPIKAAILLRVQAQYTREPKDSDMLTGAADALLSPYRTALL